MHLIRAGCLQHMSTKFANTALLLETRQQALAAAASLLRSEDSVSTAALPCIMQGLEASLAVPQTDAATQAAAFDVLLQLTAKGTYPHHMLSMAALLYIIQGLEAYLAVPQTDAATQAAAFDVLLQLTAKGTFSDYPLYFLSVAALPCIIQGSEACLADAQTDAATQAASLDVLLQPTAKGV